MLSITNVKPRFRIHAGSCITGTWMVVVMGGGGVKTEFQADHSRPSAADVQECVDLYLLQRLQYASKKTTLTFLPLRSIYVYVGTGIAHCTD